jgi:hypothetical protein
MRTITVEPVKPVPTLLSMHQRILFDDFFAGALNNRIYFIQLYTVCYSILTKFLHNFNQMLIAKHNNDIILFLQSIYDL